MMVTVVSKDVSPGIEVRDKFRRELGYKQIPEDLCEKYIKRNMELDRC